MKRLPYCVVLVVTFTAALAQTLSDPDIQKAMDRGKGSTTKQLWNEIKKKQHFRMNRAGLDPIEKTITLLSDSDRIALETAEAKRQLRETTLEDIKRNLPLGATEVLLEANCYNSRYSGSLQKWGPEGGVHLVLRVNGTIIQPQKRAIRFGLGAAARTRYHLWTRRHDYLYAALPNRLL